MKIKSHDDPLLFKDVYWIEIQIKNVSNMKREIWRIEVKPSLTPLFLRLLCWCTISIFFFDNGGSKKWGPCPPPPLPPKKASFDVKDWAEAQSIPPTTKYEWLLTASPYSIELMGTCSNNALTLASGRARGDEACTRRNKSKPNVPVLILLDGKHKVVIEAHKGPRARCGVCFIYIYRIWEEYTRVRRRVVLKTNALLFWWGTRHVVLLDRLLGLYSIRKLCSVYKVLHT